MRIGDKMKKGFTLIELLVVVLIIAILAAVALPMYKMSVEKTRASEALMWMSSIHGATVRWHLANPGDFNGLDLSLLDISIPGLSEDKKYFLTKNFKISAEVTSYGQFFDITCDRISESGEAVTGKDGYSLHMRIKVDNSYRRYCKGKVYGASKYCKGITIVCSGADSGYCSF